MSNPYELVFKIVLVGDSGVGKTNLLSRFTKDKFFDDGKSTVGVEFSTRIVETPDHHKVKAQIWDTAGQERYRAITNAYYRGAQGALLVYDCTDKKSFANLARWLQELRDHASSTLCILLCANKSESNHKAVSSEDGREFAEQYQLPFVETSAMDSQNVDKAFIQLIHDIYRHTYPHGVTHQQTLSNQLQNHTHFDRHQTHQSSSSSSSSSTHQSNTDEDNEDTKGTLANVPVSVVKLSNDVDENSGKSSSSRRRSDSESIFLDNLKDQCCQ